MFLMTPFFLLFLKTILTRNAYHKHYDAFTKHSNVLWELCCFCRAGAFCVWYCHSQYICDGPWLAGSWGIIVSLFLVSNFSALGAPSTVHTSCCRELISASAGLRSLHRMLLNIANSSNYKAVNAYLYEPPHIIKCTSQ